MAKPVPANTIAAVTAPTVATAEQVSSADPRKVGAFVATLDAKARPDLGTADGYAAAVALFLASAPADAPAEDDDAAPVVLAILHPDDSVTHVERFPSTGRGSRPTAGSPLDLGLRRKGAHAASIGATLVQVKARNPAR